MTSTESSQDGGYGWVIVLASFVVVTITDGVLFSFGLLLVVLVEDLGESTGSVSVMGGLMLGSIALSSPLSGTLSDTFGRRGVTVVGASIFSLGLFVSMFATRIWLLYLTYGIVSGFGFGLMFTPPVASVMENFDKRRGLACGIALCGSGIGMFAFNHITNQLLHVYGWRGSFLILSGIMLNGIPCGLALPRMTKKPRSQTDLPDSLTDTRIKATDSQIDTWSKVTDSQRDTRSEITGSHIDTRSKVFDSQIDTRSKETDIQRDTLSELTNRQKDPRLSDLSQSRSIMHKGKPLKRLFRIVVLDNINLFRDMQSLTIMLSAFTYGLGYYIPFAFLPRQAISLGMDKHDAAWLVSTIGICNTISRVVSGWLANRSFVNRPVLIKIVVFLLAVSMATSLLFTTFETKLIFAALYGTLYGFYVCTIPIALAEIVGPANSGKTTGMFITMMTGANIIGTPIAGWTIDVTGDFTACFLLGAAETFVSVIFLMLPNRWHKLCCSREQTSQTTHL